MHCGLMDRTNYKKILNNIYYLASTQGSKQKSDTFENSKTKYITNDYRVASLQKKSITTYKIFIEKMLIYERNDIRKFQYSILIMGEENRVFNIFTFLPFVA